MIETKVAIYARLSQEDLLQDASLSIQNQIKNLKEFCSKNNFNLIEVYSDDGYTGGNMNRPAFQQMLRDLYQYKFNTILIKDISRIGRNLMEVGHFIEEMCPLYNIRVISILDYYDSFFYDSDDSIVFRSFMNDYYLKECKKKAYKSLERRICKKPLSTIPFYGYTVQNNKWVINVQEAKVIQFIFKNYVEGKGTFFIARILKEKQIPCPAFAINQKSHSRYSFKTPHDWKPYMVQRILKRKQYTGIHINAQYSKHFNLVELKDAYEAIIPLDLYLKAQEKLKENCTRKEPPSKYASFIYNKKTGVVGHLERRTRIVNTKSGEKRLETFESRINLGNLSISVSIFECILKKEINRIFQELMQDKVYLSKILYPKPQHIQKQIEQVNSKMKATEAQIKRTIELRFSNQLEPEKYKTTITILNQTLEKLQEELIYLNQQTKIIDETYYQQIIQDFLEIQKQSKDIIIIAKMLFNKVLVEKKDNKIYFEFQYNL